MQKHIPRHRFGQNFLIDTHYIDRIIDAIAPCEGDKLLEIGPGLGALTGKLIERADKLSAIEIDRDLAARLRARFPETLTVFEQDALRFDFASLDCGDWRIVGNLPYNISSPLLFRLANTATRLRDIHVMLQKEVVQRMEAQPSTPEYGRLSVMLQAKFRVSKLFSVPPGAFSPTPKVDSAVARLLPLAENAPDIGDETLFARIVVTAFTQRRKTLRNALSSLCQPKDFYVADIDAGARAENLSVADFARLARCLLARR
ncbi:MAG: 16S rRNA (adenine(1518)-N(6)/adenine(1519)-N(6))-dimethyltransferase RsmA [Burkholderiales bacterium]|jgi:16S rRNA (adenine1518-N6/adenine1519-N6)-dimethyltransferase|nr:16S rRNA (adenine(1518)-N(6)/adenine(1519)-N(6))-dimethyltransferase RsmA [Burkholderiales bacterium]